MDVGVHQAGQDPPTRDVDLACSCADGGTSLGTFSTKKAKQLRDRGPITGLAGDTRLVGIDVRPATVSVAADRVNP